MPKTGAIHLEIHTTISKWRPKAKYKAVFNANFGYFESPKLTYLTIKTGKYRFNTPLKILILLNIYLGRYITDSNWRPLRCQDEVKTRHKPLEYNNFIAYF